MLMQLYKIDSNLKLIPAKKPRSYKTYLGIAAVFVMLGFSSAVKVNTIVEKVPVILRPEEIKFSEKALRDEIRRLHLKYEDIIVAQFRLETGCGTSTIFKQNNNCFGLKVARLRPSTALGESLGHASYLSWQNSVTDYGFWQIQNASQIRSEDEYFQLLGALYAEDTNYVNRLKKLK